MQHEDINSAPIDLCPLAVSYIYVYFQAAGGSNLTCVIFHDLYLVLLSLTTHSAFLTMISLGSAFVLILPKMVVPEMTYIVSGGTLNPTHSLAPVMRDGLTVEKCLRSVYYMHSQIEYTVDHRHEISTFYNRIQSVL